MDRVRKFRSALEKIDTILYWLLVLIIVGGGLWFANVAIETNIKIALFSMLSWLPFAVSVWLIRVFAIGIGFTLIQIAEHTQISATTLVKFHQQQNASSSDSKNHPVAAEDGELKESPLIRDSKRRKESPLIRDFLNKRVTSDQGLSSQPFS